ncbi:MAG TPA: hypothetical protein VIH31_00325 [Candidatus Paceibacterota bacterium]
MKKVLRRSKKVTIDGLAIMVAKGFDGVNKRLDGHDKKFEGIDKRFEGIDKRFDKVEEEIKLARRDILDVGDRFVARYEFDGLLIRFNRLEQKVKEKIK